MSDTAPMVTVINRTKHTRIIRATIGEVPFAYTIPRGTKKPVRADVWKVWSVSPGAVEIVATRRVKAIPIRDGAKSAPRAPVKKYPEGEPSEAWRLIELKAFAKAAGIAADHCRSKIQVMELISPPEPAGHEEDDDPDADDDGSDLPDADDDSEED